MPIILAQRDSDRNDSVTQTHSPANTGDEDQLVDFPHPDFTEQSWEICWTFLQFRTFPHYSFAFMAVEL